MKIAVIGAGIIGATASLAIKEAFPKASVTVFADVFSPDTTGDGSAGLWCPYLAGNTPDDDILRWSSEMYRWLLSIWKSEAAAETGICLLPVTRISSAPEGFATPTWISSVFGARELLSNDLQRLNAEQNAKYTGGWQFITFTCEPTRLIPWILKKFQSLGGIIKQRKIQDLEELFSEGFDLLVNCAGLGARDLIKDLTVKPVRGQVSRVDAWMFQAYLNDDDDGNYVIPNTECVVLGGTHQENDYDRKVREEDARFIYEGCCKMAPALRGSKILNQWVGLRPSRPRVRLEIEQLKAKNGKKFMVIHNYGHGGSGITLSWGCALEVVQIIRDLEAKKTPSKL